ncbi:hypothetical protein LC608_20160 [Nostoc sp. XA010]|nr:hypothetical protein [Nostoc sp. XA010]
MVSPLKTPALLKIVLNYLLLEDNKLFLSLWFWRRRQLQAIADVVIVTLVQVYNPTSRQLQPEVVQDYSSLKRVSLE